MRMCGKVRKSRDGCSCENAIYLRKSQHQVSTGTYAAHNAPSIASLTREPAFGKRCP